MEKSTLPRISDHDYISLGRQVESLNGSGWLQTAKKASVKVSLWTANYFPVFHHEIHIPQRLNILERVRRHGDDVRGQAGSERATLLVNTQQFGSICSHALHDVRVRHARLSPPGQVIEHEIGARLARDIKKRVGAEGHLDADAIGAPEAVRDLGPQNGGIFQKVAVPTHHIECGLRKIGAHKKDAFLFHELELSVGQTKSVFHGIDATLDDVLRRLASIDVYGNRASRVMSFVHC